jgi:RecJ-like exonuclease
MANKLEPRFSVDLPIRMDESGAAKVCPYCDGKGSVSVLVDLLLNNDPLEELDRKTWIRKKCPLCDGKGRILQPGVLQP